MGRKKKISIKAVSSEEMLRELIRRQEEKLEICQGDVEVAASGVEEASEALTNLNQIYDEWTDE